MIGRTLAHFEISAKLGEGGMGEVYRAEDAKLGREVAVKVLPAAVARDAERMARFEREARVLASLNHPGIAAIYQVEEDAGVRFLVMELAEGEDLAARLERAPLTVDEALAIGLQIAEALEAAHESGVVHRDLKPANVMLGADGRIKVLDFGLAKALEGDRGGDGSLSLSPTLTAGMTRAGVILGTAAYMSPEQAVGKAVDKRADIWAFGCLLYEMLAGRKAYDGESVTETLSAVMRDEPDWAKLPETVPASIRRLLRRCLAKDARERLRDIGEARIVLAQPYPEPDMEPETEGAERGAVAQSSRGAGRRWPGLVAAALAVAAAALGGAWWASRSKPAGVALAPALVRVTSDAGVAITPAVAPAGNLIAYASDRGGDGDLDIWVQPLPSGQPVQVTRSDTDDLEPHFSPDGSRIVFRSERDGGGVYVVPALGGTERLIVAKGREPRFSPDGRWIAYSMGGRGSASQLYLVESTGSAARRLAEDFLNADSPVWSPDGRHLLFQGLSPATDRGEPASDWWTLSVESGQLRSVGARQALGEWFTRSRAEVWLADPERLIVTQFAGDSSSLWELPISRSRQIVSGPLQRLTAGTGIDARPSVVSDPEGSRIFFSSMSEKTNLWRLPIEADSTVPNGPPERVTDSVARARWPSMSDDGTKLAFLSTRLGSTDVWLKDLETGVETPLTMTPESERYPQISPDGTRVSFIREGGQFTVTTDGGVPVLLTDETQWVTDWPADDLILARRHDGIVRIDPGTGEITQLIHEEGRNFYFAVASPDLEWFTFMEWSLADRTRRYVARLGNELIPESEWVPITDGETVDEEGAWAPSGVVIYYVSERDGTRCLWAQRLEPETKRPLGEPVAVLHMHEMRHSMVGTGVGPKNIAVTPDAIYFGMRELASNIWMGTIEVR